MNRSGYLFAGIVGSFALSCAALVVLPQSQLGSLQPQFAEDEGKIVDIYPIDNSAILSGQAVYASEGCATCHSQQIRDEQNGTDLERGWGVRRTVARDYIFEQRPFLGNMRLGPDLANVGSPKWRNEPENENAKYKPAKRDAAWQLLHLYAPTTVIKISNMPPYRYLFETKKISGQRSNDALALTGKNRPPEGYEVVPKIAAKDLVAYLLSLNKSHPLKEVKNAAPEVASK